MITPAQFLDVVDRALRPMLTTAGFAMVATEDFTVEFRGEAASLAVTYEPRAHELSVWLSDHGDSGEPPLELPDALRATDCPASDVESVSLIQAHDVQPLERLLGRVADVIGRHAAQFLDGDARSFDSARRLRADRARAYTTGVVNAPAIAEADAAWQQRNYALVSEILRPIRDDLDETHRRRLVFAERKLPTPTNGERFAITVNGRITMVLEPEDGRTLEDELARPIGMLDGTKWYSVIVWKLADGKDVDQVDFATVDEYIQCAGSAADGLTCEIRQDGVQYVIGREAVGELSCDRVIEWNASRLTVQENEVLDSGETTQLFVSYVETGAAPSGFVRRRIELPANPLP